METKLTDLDILRADLVHQLKTADDIDWDYFISTALAAQDAANKEGRNIRDDV